MQYGENNAQKSLSVGENILKTYPDINAVICPDANGTSGNGTSS